MKLSEFELDVMQLFWQKPQASAPEIHEIISQDRDVGYSTVKTIIDRLEQKSALRRTGQIGRTIYYASAVARESISTPLLNGLLKRVFAGKPKTLIAHLIENESLSTSDIESLQAMLIDKQRQNKE
ncbi:BlaI/MecI/CopY family transcriptional regulator [Neptunicella sp.]|uniref:BlaI/MecI/CopY family transcriptional regulator n=1 Tax=Neptunicella sp. TaxID=2125986 RepID=UPI003F69352B